MIELKQSRILRKSLLQLVTIFGFLAFASTGAQAFQYDGPEGPGFWGNIAGASACAGSASDSRQSPINISNAVTDYSLKTLETYLYSTPIKLINNGHTIELEYETSPHASTLNFGGTVYTLAQFHFHSLSEHTVNNERGAMEMHAVFKDAVSGKIAVIGLIFKIGASNSFLQKLIDAGLPKTSTDTSSVSTGEINLADGLSSKSKYYTYPGSLTTQPCSETVTWILLKDQKELSSSQYKAFRDILGNDFRPTQNINNRVPRVTASESSESSH